MPSARTNPLAIDRRLPRPSYRRSPRGRLRAVDRSNGHAPTDVESWAKLTFESDHSTGADHTGTRS